MVWFVITARPVASIGDENANCAPALSEQGSFGMKHRHLEQTRSLRERLVDEINCLREEAHLLPPSHRREMLLRRAQQDETAMQIDAWLSSPGLRAPT
jgi:hypothetical protein